MAGAAAAALDDAEAPPLIVACGGLMPVGLGNLDDAVDTSLFIDRSDGVGDAARASGAPGVVDSLIVFHLILFFITGLSVDLVDRRAEYFTWQRAHPQNQPRINRSEKEIRDDLNDFLIVIKHLTFELASAVTILLREILNPIKKLTFQIAEHETTTIKMQNQTILRGKLNL